MTASAAGFTSNQVAVYSHPPTHQPFHPGSDERNTSAPHVFPRARPGNSMPPPIARPPGPRVRAPARRFPSGNRFFCARRRRPTAVRPRFPSATTSIGHITYAVSQRRRGHHRPEWRRHGSSPGLYPHHRHHCPDQQQRRLLLYLPAGQDRAQRCLNRRHQCQRHAEHPPGAHGNGNGYEWQHHQWAGTQLRVHQPGQHRRQRHRRVTASFPSNSAITAICQPTTCNPAPINVMGTLGTGVPVLSNFVQIASPGKNSNLHLGLQPRFTRISCLSISRPGPSATRSSCPTHPIPWCWIPPGQRFISAAIKS